MSEKFERLKGLLRELFQLDQPDLDFGIYRIMHAKSAEVTQFLDRELLPQVRAAFEQYQPASKAEIERELSQAIEQARGLGVDPETTQKVKDLRVKLASDAVDLDQLEAEVYDHLFQFFRRYYSEGDFLSKRVYKPGVYAIPYEGEEVKLHWANADQYYIKTSEYLRDYAFRLKPNDERNPMRVHFRLVEAAEGEHGNVKPAEGKDRVFILAPAGDGGHDFIAAEKVNGQDELVVKFVYRPATVADWTEEAKASATAAAAAKPPTQSTLSTIAVKAILAVEDETLVPWIAELAKPHVKVSGEQADYSRLEGHLNQYTARHTFDYFIHKDLGAFLKRELDFFIKNEIIHLDDVERESAPRVEQYLSKIRVIRRIAQKVIDFLAQLEDFQKRLWLKRKFVIETVWCIRAGCIPDEFLPEIAANDAQRDEWVRCLGIDSIAGDLAQVGYSNPLTAAFLKAHSSLMVDTRHFSEEFTSRLLSSIEDLNDLVDGTLFHAENFHATVLMRAKLRQHFDAIYADPPFNTAATQIIYKNEYKHSSWLALLADRIRNTRQLLAPTGMMCLAIDDAEFSRLSECLTALFGEADLIANAVIRSNPHGRAMASGFSINHEYALFVGDPAKIEIGRLPRNEARMARYPLSDESGPFTWINFRKTGAASSRPERPKLYYPVFVNITGRVRIPSLEWSETAGWATTENPNTGEETVFPLDDDGTERVWTLGVERATREADSVLEARKTNGKWQVYRKYRPHEDGALPGTWWDDAKYSATESGTKTITDLFGQRELFSYPKSVYLVEDCLRVLGGNNVLDYFAGSGTTGHAAINLNRSDGGRRRFALVEMGRHFETVLVPRLKKVTFSPEWKEGKPERFATAVEAERSPRILKVMRLESYEDALNNLDVRREERQQQLLSSPEAQGTDGLREQYLLRYMLDVETRGSPSLLNVDAFINPTAYKLKVRQPGTDESREVNVDLLETFNWLIGLTVRHLAAPQTLVADFDRDAEGRLQIRGRLRPAADGAWWFRTVEGTTPDGRKTLVIWRKRPGGETPEGLEKDNLVLNEWFAKSGFSTKDYEFDLIYVNGDNNLENLKTPDDTWKVRLIEEDFHRLMFDVEDV